jgi:hypothetical protein
MVKNMAKDNIKQEIGLFIQGFGIMMPWIVEQSDTLEVKEHLMYMKAKLSMG